MQARIRNVTISRQFLAMVCILAIGFGIRLAGIDWDSGLFLHPDERHIVLDLVDERIDVSWPPSLTWLDPEESPINPRPQMEDGTVLDFAYGTFPVYLVDTVSTAWGAIAGDDSTNAIHALYVGRSISILLDTATILICYLTASLLAGRVAGLFAATIYAFLPIAIQNSHFFTVDAWMTCFLAFAVYGCMRACQSRRARDFAIAGLWLGLAMASKSSAAAFAPVFLLALVLASYHDTTVSPFLRKCGASIGAFLLMFFVGEPFAFIQPGRYIDAFRLQADIQSGRIDAPFTQQYVDTTRFSYPFDQAIRFGMGPVAVLLGILGAGCLLWLVARRSSLPATILGAWMLISLMVILVPESKFMRYLLPIAPALAVTAAVAAFAMVMTVKARARLVPAMAIASALMVLSTSYGAAFSSVTSQEHTRVSASVWLLEHLPPGSTTSSELWDDRLPLSLSPGWSAEMRRIDDVQIDLFDSGPTLGDISLLANSVAYLPGGGSLSSSLDAGHIGDVVNDLRDLTPSDLASVMPQDFARFQSSLLKNAAAMTSSAELSRDLSQLSRTIAMRGELDVSDMTALADAIQRAFDASTLSSTYNLLDRVDYYVLASNRVQNAIEQNPWRYAVASRMYDLLASGEIGFDRAATFTSHPELVGFEFPDAGGDESYLNYDHPEVTIFQKEHLVPFDQYVTLNGAAAFRQVQPTRTPEDEPLTFQEPVSELPAVHDARWSESLTGNSWGAAMVWIAMLVLLQLAAIPVARLVFRTFPDRGWGLARLIGIIVPATVIWWLSSVSVLQFEARWVVISLALFALAAWIWLRGGTAPAQTTRSRKTTIALAESVFWVVFAIFLIYRLINPDSWHPIWGGEKPMEFAQINAILRSATFPPVDPWYAGGYINYYYYGLYLTAWLIKLTGIPIEFAFNLAQPTFIAMIASSAFSVGSAVGSRLTHGRVHPAWSGLASVFLVSLAGNMRSVGQLVTSLQDDGAVGNAFDFWVWTPSRAIAYTITEFPYFTGLYADLHPHVVALPITILCIGIGASFAFDMTRPGAHLARHSISRLVVAGFAFGILYPTNAWDLPVYAVLGLVSIIAGGAAFKSSGKRLAGIVATIVPIAAIALTISAPFLLNYEALFGSIETVRTHTSLLELESHLGGQLLLLTVAVPTLLSLLVPRKLTLPPLETTLAFASLLLFRWACTQFDSSLVHTLDRLTVVAIGTIWLVAAFDLARSARGKLDFGLPRITQSIVVGIGALAVLGALLLDRQVAGVYLGIAFAMTSVWLSKSNPGPRFLASIVAAACFVGAGLEMVYLVDDLSATDSYRMNTVFKFYNQIWVLLGIASGALIGSLVPPAVCRLIAPRKARSGLKFSRPRPHDWPIAVTTTSIIVLLLSTVYPITATAARLDIRFPNHPDGFTLNSYAWMDYGTVQLSNGTVISFDEDHGVIDWFNEEVKGTPVIAEASFGPYRCNGSRISIGTGLPSVLGWQRHEMQQRHPEVLPQRELDLRTLYGSPDVDTKLEILNRYDVGYIVVGQLERNYPLSYQNCIPMDQTQQFSSLDLDAGIAAFEGMVGGSLEIAFQSGSTVVYRVVGNT